MGSTLYANSRGRTMKWISKFTLLDHTGTLRDEKVLVWNKQKKTCSFSARIEKSSTDFEMS